MNYSLFDQTEPIVSKEKEKVVIQALRLLISFTTLNKFCDPSIKPAKSTVCELFSFVLIIKLIVQRPLRMAGAKYLYGLYLWV